MSANKLAAALASHADDSETQVIDAPFSGGTEIAVIPTNGNGALVDPERMAQIQQGGYSANVRDVLGAEDISMPYLRVAQAMSQEVGEGNATAGQITVLGSPAVDSADLVIVSVGKKRTLRDVEPNSKTVLCSSNNGVIGMGNPGGVCDNCPMSQFVGGKAPKCVFAYTYQVFSLTHGKMVIMDLQKTAMKAAKDVNYCLLQDGPENFVLTMTTTRQKNQNNQIYFVPSFARRDITDDEREMVASRVGA